MVSNAYDAAGRLAAVTKGGPAGLLESALFCYNGDGSGLTGVRDLGLDGMIDMEHTDQIVSNGVRYVARGGDWWRENATFSAQEDGSSALTRLRTVLTRLTGLGTSGEHGVLASEVVTVDAYGGETMKRLWRDRAAHRIVQGFSEDFAYDPIGNRVSATDYDENGSPRMSRYTANALNQYVSRTVPGWASVRGLAATNAYISVNGNEAFTVAGRVVPNAPKYYFGSDDFDNSAQSGWAELETYATVNGPTNDFVSAVTNRVFVPQTPEIFAYDADGNLIEDGRFRYWWNGENRLVRAEEKMPPEGRAAHVIVYAYDHQGRNVAKDGVLQIWDAYNIVVENAAASNVVINAWGLDIDGTMQGAGGVGGLLAVARNDDMSLPAYDANGNITEYVDSLGGVESHTDYSSFGRGLMRSEGQPHSHGFSTKPKFLLKVALVISWTACLIHGRDRRA